MIYILVSIIVFGFLVNDITKRYITDKIICTREIKESHIEQGESAEIVITIENRKIIPVTFLQFTEYFRGSEILNNSYMAIMPFQRIRRTYSKKFEKRGVYELFKAKITCGDFIGFTNIDKEYYLDNKVVVYPKPIDIEKNFIAVGNLTGENSVKKMIISDPLLICGIREYTGVEPMNTIHWPSSLRNGELMVKNFDYTCDISSMICLNLYTKYKSWMGINKDDIERCFSTVRSLVDLFEEEGMKYGYVSNSIYIDSFKENQIIKPNIGLDHYYDVLERLARDNDISYNNMNEFIDQLISNRINAETLIMVTSNIYIENVENINKLCKFFNKVILFVINDKNIDLISDNIIKYVIGGNDK